MEQFTLSTIAKSVAQLQRFLRDQNVAEIINKLTFLELPESCTDEIIASLRNDLQRILLNSQNQQIIFGDLSLKDAAYHSLLALAETYPLNDMDPITLGLILPENRVVISSGHQFDINSLIDFHNRRVMRETETFSDYGPEGKLLINPLTNSTFSPDDTIHIKKIAGEHNISIRRSGRDEILGPQSTVASIPQISDLLPRILIIPDLMEFLRENQRLERLTNAAMIFITASTPMSISVSNNANHFFPIAPANEDRESHSGGFIEDNIRSHNAVPLRSGLMMGGSGADVISMMTLGDIDTTLPFIVSNSGLLNGSYLPSLEQVEDLGPSFSPQAPHR